MARKSKRLVLNEAIRRGQAKIAEGLKTGQMRSDKDAFQSGIKNPDSPVEIKARPDVRNTGFFKSKDMSRKHGLWPSRMNSTVLMYAAAVVLLGVAIWIILAVSGSDQSVPGEGGSGQISTETETGDEAETAKNRFSFFGGDRAESSQPAGTGNEALSASVPAKSGDNVIWIQSIPAGRKDELRSVAAFFDRKGIETEITVDRASGFAVLVTKAGFDENPVKKGTAGYELLQRIKQLGIDYVRETEDTKFGQKPFQDALGYKRQ